MENTRLESQNLARQAEELFDKRADVYQALAANERKIEYATDEEFRKACDHVFDKHRRLFEELVKHGD